VWVNTDGIIEVKMGSSISRQNLQKLIDGSYLIAQTMDERGEPIYCLADVSVVKRVDPLLATLGGKVMGYLPYERFAMYGAGPAVTAAMKVIAAALPSRDKFKMFRTRDEAVAWLGKPPRLQLST